MSVELPANVERDIERYAQSERITIAEATVRLIQSGLKSVRRNKGEDLVTDDMIAQLKALDPSFGILEDLSNEQIDRLEADIRRTKREGFPRRG